MDTLTDTIECIPVSLRCSAIGLPTLPSMLRDPRSDPRPDDQVWLTFLIEENAPVYHFVVTGRLANQVDYTLDGEPLTCHRNRWVTFFEPGNKTHTEWTAAPQGEAAGSGLDMPLGDQMVAGMAAFCDSIEEERAPALMTPGEHELLLRKIGPARAAWAYYRTWLARHRWFIEADDRGDWELIPVFAREMERKEAERRAKLTIQLGPSVLRKTYSSWSATQHALKMMKEYHF